MVDKAMSTMDIDASIAGTERLLAQGADGSVILVSAISAYVIDDLIASTAATPTTGDYLLGFRGTDEKTMTLDLVAAYAVTYAYSAASAVTPAASGDLLLVNRSGTIYDMDVDVLKTYALVGIQATVLNTSALGSATLGATDLVTVCQVGTPTSPKTATLTALTTYLDAALIALGTMQTSACAYLKTYTAALSAKSTGAAADTLYVINSGTAYKMTLATIADYCVDATYDLPWLLIAASKYTALPTTTSTLAMSDTSDISIGDPVKFTWSGTTYYAVVTAMSGNSSITIAGAPFSTSASLTDLYVGTPGQVKNVTYWVSDLFGDAIYDILSTVGRYERWEGSAAYLVAFAATSGEADTGAAQPKINVEVGGNAVSTNDTNKGLQISGTPGTWIANSAVEIHTTNYAVSRGEAIEILCTEAGTNGDAADLSITLTFVYE